MPVSIVVGGQFGSEGKGKVAHFLAQERNASIVVRCGGSNSGHTVIDENGEAQIFQHLPTAAILPETQLALCAGSYIDLDILSEEINRVDIDEKRLIIDPFSIIITEENKKSEANSGLIEGIGSTGSGTGAAVMSRLKRGGDPVFAKDIPALGKFVKDVNFELRSKLNRNERILIEGTQGFGLSPLHSKMNPYVTTRDTTAAGFLSEVGLSPFDVDEVAMVLRALPIRVGGNSGPLPNEIDWKIVSNECGYSNLCEYTSVTKHVRRIARFDAEVVLMAIAANRPSCIFLNHIDYIGLSESKEGKFDMKKVQSIESAIGCDVQYVGTSPNDIWLKDFI